VALHVQRSLDHVLKEIGVWVGYAGIDRSILAVTAQRTRVQVVESRAGRSKPVVAKCSMLR
jgi:hypothetical protein